MSENGIRRQLLDCNLRLNMLEEENIERKKEVGELTKMCKRNNLMVLFLFVFAVMNFTVQVFDYMR